MKTINIRNLQHHLRSIIDEVNRGEIIEVTRHKKIVARILPPKEKKQPEPWPDLHKRLDRIYGNKRISASTSDIVYGDRD